MRDLVSGPEVLQVGPVISTAAAYHPTASRCNGNRHAIDTTRTGPPGVGGRPGDATVTTDSVGMGTVRAGTPETTDTISPWTSTPQDTLGPSDTGVQDTAMDGDTLMMHGDSAMTNHPVPDTTTAR